MADVTFSFSYLQPQNYTTTMLMLGRVPYNMGQSGILSLNPSQNNFLSSLFERGLVEHKIFTFKYRQGRSHLMLGSTDFFSMPINLQNVGRHVWAIDISSLNIVTIDRGTVVLTTEPLNAVLDSSISSILLPLSTLRDFADWLVMMRWYCLINLNGRVVCDNKKGDPFELQVEQGSITLHITSDTLMGACLTQEVGQQTCHTNIGLSIDDDTIRLGEPLFKKYDIAFNAEVGRIGLAEVILKNTSKEEESGPSILTKVFFAMAVAAGLILLLFVLAWGAKKIILGKKTSFVAFVDDTPSTFGISSR